jgi:hypothetical protein
MVSIIMLNAIMVSVFVLNAIVFIPSVFQCLCHYTKCQGAHTLIQCMPLSLGNLGGYSRKHLMKELIVILIVVSSLNKIS